MSYHRPQVSSYDNSAHFGYSDLFDMLGGASDVSEDPLGGYDETGIRPRARDMNSGPEKGDNVIQVILNHTFFELILLVCSNKCKCFPMQCIKCTYK